MTSPEPKTSDTHAQETIRKAVLGETSRKHRLHDGVYVRSLGVDPLFA
jgi:hypothetical protein